MAVSSACLSPGCPCLCLSVCLLAFRVRGSRQPKFVCHALYSQSSSHPRTSRAPQTPRSRSLFAYEETAKRGIDGSHKLARTGVNDMTIKFFSHDRGAAGKHRGCPVDLLRRPTRWAEVSLICHLGTPQRRSKCHVPGPAVLSQWRTAIVCSPSAGARRCIAEPTSRSHPRGLRSVRG